MYVGGNFLLPGVVVLGVGMVVEGYGVLFSQDTSAGQLQTFKLGSN